MNDLYIIVDKDNKYITETEDIERAKFLCNNNEGYQYRNSPEELDKFINNIDLGCFD